MITMLSVKDKDGKHRFELNDHFITEDIWGAHLTFDASAPQTKKLLQDIEKVVLSEKPAKKRPHDGESVEPIDKSIKSSTDLFTDQLANDYTFVPGRIAW